VPQVQHGSPHMLWRECMGIEPTRDVVAPLTGFEDQYTNGATNSGITSCGVPTKPGGFPGGLVGVGQGVQARSARASSGPPETPRSSAFPSRSTAARPASGAKCA